MLKNGLVRYFACVFFVIFSETLFVTCNFDQYSKKLDRTNFVCLLFGSAFAVFAFYRCMHSKMLRPGAWL